MPGPQGHTGRAGGRERHVQIFTRDVPFDFEPGEPFSKISLGVCNNNPDVNICARDDEGPIFFDNLLPNGFSGGLTTRLRRAS